MINLLYTNSHKRISGMHEITDLINMRGVNQPRLDLLQGLPRYVLQVIFHVTFVLHNSRHGNSNKEKNCRN